MGAAPAPGAGASASPSPGAAAAASPLIGFDWGTSNLRAFLIAGDGRVLDQRHRPWGIMRLPDRSAVVRPDRDAAPFEAAVAGIAGDWIERWPDAPLVACGMVGSRQGWREAPYLAVPANPADLARASVTVAIGAGRHLAILPGLCQGRDDPDASLARMPRAGTAPDVMRGEETQVVGALARDPGLADDCWLVLPGTHSKWVRVIDGRLTGFTTHMTGELFDVIGRHSILAQSIAATDGPAGPSAAIDDESGADEARAFREGVLLAADSDDGLTALLFGVRTRSLLRGWSPEAGRGLLSGLLIGHEVSAATRPWQHSLAPIVLIGEPALCERYRQALAVIGIQPRATMENPAADGLQRLGRVLDPVRGPSSR